ncbi:hypothetical protein [Chryseobacterium oryzae]|uniref:EpsG family protein n=1 Tax=Chryseobacterium oryzae TaxID=2929799 RepID=A0ABY4BGZ3_9FLAO|nr:hypothetical protein [Chryseobacterium oryzae]UOE38009.1 hypothetical protein MTP08_13295 [Chryseobacterium oryzae]
MLKYLNFISKYIILLYIVGLLYIFLTTGNTLGQEKYLNYTSGYIRRGFVGELLFLLIKHFNISIELLEYNLSITIKVIALLLVNTLIYIKKINFFLIFSPPLMLAGFQFSAGEQYTYGYLDFLLLLIFLSQIIIYYRKNNFTLYCILGIIGILIHEVYFFITIIPSFFILGNKKKLIIYIILSSFLFLLQGIFKGNIHQVEIINQNWNKLGVYNKNIDVLKKFVSTGSINYWWNMIKTTPQKIGFMLNNLYILFFIMLFAFKTQADKKNIKCLIILLCFQNLVFLSLSIIANDFGRWYFLLFTSIVLFYYIKDAKINICNNRINSNSFVFTTFTKILAIIHPYRYIVYLLMGLPFGNWTFNFFYHSLVIKNILKYSNSFFYFL